MGIYFARTIRTLPAVRRNIVTIISVFREIIKTIGGLKNDNRLL